MPDSILKAMLRRNLRMELDEDEIVKAKLNLINSIEFGENEKAALQEFAGDICDVYGL